MRAGCFILNVFLLSRGCMLSVSVRRGTGGWSVVSDCVFSLSNSLVFFVVVFKCHTGLDKQNLLA